MPRPTRKQPEWLNRALALMAEGKSKPEAAVLVGVGKRQLNNVLKTLPDWSGVKVPAR